MGAIKDRNPTDIREIIPIHEVIKSDQFAADIGIESSQFGRADSLRYAILNMVVDGQYEKAGKELKLYQTSKPEYPDFEERVDRFIEYSIDLINAVRAKRNFPGRDMLRQAKRQELSERIHEHFDELKQVLHKIENIEIELRVEDLRSTVWILKTASYSLFFIFAASVLLHVYRESLLWSAYHVSEDLFNRLTLTLVSFF